MNFLTDEQVRELAEQAAKRAYETMIQPLAQQINLLNDRVGLLQRDVKQLVEWQTRVGPNMFDTAERQARLIKQVEQMHSAVNALYNRQGRLMNQKQWGSP